LRQAARYLWSRQAKDGGWHSVRYGLLRSGQSLTPFVLEALLEVPDRVSPAPAEGVAKAVGFSLKNTDASGAVGLMEPAVPDYPNYATALALTALSRASLPNRQINAGPWIAYLRRQQFTEQNGWRRADSAYGAWGMGGDIRRPPNPGHVDLSMTRHVLEALAAVGATRDDPAFEKAAVFVERCQNYDPREPGRFDGGFFFSTVVPSANKAGSDGEQFRSYGTATADGILSLLAMGRPPADERVVAAGKWLTSHHSDDGAAGFPGKHYRRWTEGLRYYYAAASTAALRKLAVIPNPPLTPALRKLQRPDGSWANPENLVKEDDPLIATALALRAIANDTARTPGK
jgi:squalene-hopene/tetraprenyl-beta-curcumene cyclase